MTIKNEKLPPRESELFAELDDGFYSEEEIGSLLEDDEISDEEEAFMVGYMGFDEG